MLKRFSAKKDNPPARIYHPQCFGVRRPWPERPADPPGGPAQVTGSDGRWLARLLAKTRTSPAGHAALAWAAAHDLRFEVSRKDKDDGYYTPGTGVITLVRGRWHGSTPETVGHEIRHAWQDHYGLLPSFTAEQTLAGDLGTQLIQLALIEADAAAYGALVAREIKERRPGVRPVAQLIAAFMAWPARYGIDYHIQQVQRARVSAVLLPEEGLVLPPVHNNGINPWRREEFNKLGRGFTGGNYLARETPGWREHIRKTMLTPRVALAAFDAAATRVSVIGFENDIRKGQLRMRLKTPIKRLPLPK